MKIAKMLTIAGSDSGGGAGIQADVRTGTLLGCHVTTAITAVTAQNSLGVQSFEALSPGFVAAQIDSILSDMGADAAKTGMLADAGIIEAVSDRVGRWKVKNLVVDPVMVAKGGAKLLADDAVNSLKTKLLPLAMLVTPNVPEAETLAGIRISDEKSAIEACSRILDLGPGAILLKGGHMEGGEVVDVLAAKGAEPVIFRSPRLTTPHTHGTGCTLSAATAAYLAKGLPLGEAVVRARAYLIDAIETSYPTGGGHGSTNPYAASGCGRYEVIERLFSAWEILEACQPFGLIPEVQANLAEALPGATRFSDVAAFPGRIIRVGSRIARSEGPRFSASRHMAKILLASARRDSPFRAVMNVRYGVDVLDACRACGFSVTGFSRYEEPPEVKAAEGSTLEWGTGKVLDELGRAPDAIFDEGDVGKEPMVRIFGTDAIDAARKVAAVWGKLGGR